MTMCAECEWENRLEQAEEMLDDDSLQFAYDTILGIKEWIEENEHVTENQCDALDNIEEKSKP